MIYFGNSVFFATPLNSVPKTSALLASPSSEFCVLFLKFSSGDMDIYFIITNYGLLML